MSERSDASVTGAAGPAGQQRELIVCEVRGLGVQPAEDTAYFLWWAESVPVANDSVGVERMHIDERAPAIARGGIEIDADAQIVWDVLTDIDEWPAWNPDVKTAAEMEATSASWSACFSA